MGTWIVGSLVAIAIGLAIRSIVKDKKSGKSVQCGVDCSKCKGSCH